MIIRYQMPHVVVLIRDVYHSKDLFAISLGEKLVACRGQHTDVYLPETCVGENVKRVHLPLYQHGLGN